MGRLRKAILTMSPLSLIGFLVDSNYHAGVDAMEEGRFAKAAALFQEAITPTIHLEPPTHEGSEISADLNVIGSYYELGKIYLFGMGGMPKNEGIAIDYLKKAASSRRHTSIRTQAQLLIGSYYKDNDGSEQKECRAWALYWLGEASKNGSNDAIYNLILYYKDLMENNSFKNASEIQIGDKYQPPTTAIDNALNYYERINKTRLSRELPAEVSCAVKYLRKEIQKEKPQVISHDTP